MGELQKEFLKQAILSLQNLQKDFAGETNNLSSDLLNRYFRQLHTLKGSSSTFSLNSLAKIAHETENLLQAVQNRQILQSPATTKIFQDSLNHLIAIAESYQANLQPIEYTEFIKLIRGYLKKLQALPNFEFNQLNLPQQIVRKLSAQEKDRLNSAFQNENNLYILEANFELVTFAEDFKLLRKLLDQSGEIIAVLSESPANSGGKLSFQILFVTKLAEDNLEKLVEKFAVKIIFRDSAKPQNVQNSQTDIINNLITECQKNALKLNKQVNFETHIENFKTSIETLILIHKIALHLLNNAIDHAIETIEERNLSQKIDPPTIKIYLSQSKNIVNLTIEDNGRGIAQEDLPQIFQSGFTTKQSVSTISGRGVGLDAVKEMVESVGGKIKVETKLNFGTKFIVSLP